MHLDIIFSPPISLDICLKFEITLPAEIFPENISEVFASKMFGRTLSYPFFYKYGDLNTIVVENLCTIRYDSYQDARITIDGLTNPNYVTSISGFIINIYDSNNQLVIYSKSGSIDASLF